MLQKGKQAHRLMLNLWFLWWVTAQTLYCQWGLETKFSSKGKALGTLKQKCCKPVALVQFLFGGTRAMGTHSSQSLSVCSTSGAEPLLPVDLIVCFRTDSSSFRHYSHGKADGRNYASWHSNLRLCALRLMQPRAGWAGGKGHFPSLAASSTIASHPWQLSRNKQSARALSFLQSLPLPCFSFWRLYKFLDNSRSLWSALHPIHHPWECDLRKVTGFPGFTHHQQPTKGASGTECITKNRTYDPLTAVL